MVIFTKGLIMKYLISLVFILLFLNGCFSDTEQKTKFYGNVDVRTVSLAFRVSGKIEGLYFNEGHKVKKGDILASLDDSLYKENLNQIDAQIQMQEAALSKLKKGYRVEEIQKAKASLEQKKIDMDRLEKEFKRVSNLYSENSLSEQNYDNAKAAYQSAKALYEYAKSSLTMLQNGYEKEDILSAQAKLNSLIAQKNIAQINLDDTKLSSSVDGTVITRVYEEGSIVNSSQAVFEIAKDEEYWVRSYMSEKYLGLIKIGDKALVYNDNGKTYKGEVSFISPIAEFTPKTVQTQELRSDLVYRFRIILNEFDDSIKQGMPVTVTFPDIDFDD